MVVQLGREPRRRPGLSRFLNQIDGMTADEANTRATAQLEFMSEGLAVELEDMLRTLALTVEKLDQADRGELLQEMFSISNNVFSAAGTLGHDHLGAAARSLCRLVDTLQTAQIWEPEALKLHLHAFNYLNPARSVGNDAALALLTGLHEITDRIVRRVAETSAVSNGEEAPAQDDRAILVALCQELHLLRERSMSIQELTAPLLRMVGMNQSALVNVQSVDLVAQTLDQLVLFISRYLDLAVSDPSAALKGSIQGITLGELSRRLSQECLGAKDQSQLSAGVELFS